VDPPWGAGVGIFRGRFICVHSEKVTTAYIAQFTCLKQRVISFFIFAFQKFVVAAVNAAAQGRREENPAK